MSSILSYTSGLCPITGFRHIEVEHDGTVTWFEMQELKNKIFGPDVVGFEMYPPKDTVVNGGSKEFHFRHIWVWPQDVEWPNLRKDNF